MADFGTAVRNLRPGYIAKTVTMWGYVRRHEIGSRDPNPNYVSGGSEPEYLYYAYADGKRTRVTDSSAISAILSKLFTPEEVYASAASPAANVVFDLEFVENVRWQDEGDRRRVYVFRCYQSGGTETTPGDSRVWRACSVPSGTGTGEPPVSPTPTVLPVEGADSYSDLMIDAPTFGMFVSQDWEYNQVTEAAYVASSTSVARW